MTRVVHFLLLTRRPWSRADTTINRLLVVNDARATATIITFQLPFLTEPSAPANPSTYQVPPRPWMVTRDSSRIFSTQSIRSTGLHPVRWKGSHKELSRLHPEWLHSEQSCFCQKNGKPTAAPAPDPSKLDPSVRVLLSVRSTLTAGATFNYTQSRRARGSPVFLPYARQPRDDARVLFLTSLDLLDRVVANVLDEY
jgi:hypothetical protein